MNKKKILIGCLLFKEFTGSEMYVYELAKGLLKHNYDVSVVSPNIGGVLTDLAIKDGLVVTPSMSPVERYFSISLRSAESKNIFISTPYFLKN